MTIEFVNTEADHMDHQLYSFSRSKEMREGKKRSTRMMVIAGLIMIIYSLIQREYELTAAYAGVFVVFYVAWFGWYRPRHYKRLYQAGIREYLKTGVRSERITFGSVEVIHECAGTQRTIPYGSFREFIELPRQILLRTEGLDLLIPFVSVPDMATTKALLTGIAARHSIQYIDDRDWVWK